MKLLPQVHRLQAVFEAAPQVERSVYFYLIEGERCYLIDSGVAGCVAQLAAYLRTLGRTMAGVAAIFLTHSHPDHIGGACAIRARSGCKVYACAEERAWIEQIDRQYAARPIPNFYRLADASVPVDDTLWDGRRIALEPGLTLRVVDAAGHSAGSKALLLEERGVLFTGDAIPVAGDIPIYESARRSLKTLDRLQGMEEAAYYCAAWDECRARADALDQIARARALLADMDRAVRASLRERPDLAPDALFARVSAALGRAELATNPLFRRSVQANRKEAMEG